MEKTTTKPPKASRSRDVGAAEAPTPQSPADIPGLGPIRVRALQKAGFNTLSSLKTASLETLLAVPGMSEIKARHIQEYLAQFPVLPDRAPEPKPASPSKSEPEEGKQAEKRAVSEEAALPVQKAAAHALNRVVTLLVTAAEASLRPRLLRELSRFASRAEALIAEALQLSAKDRERVENRLKRVTELLADAWTQNDLDKKTQARLAEDLSDLTDKL